jgi:hypothetical protein
MDTITSDIIKVSGKIKANNSQAVRQQRKSPKESLDDFPTPPWATRALIEHILPELKTYKGIILEPACNRGHMVKPLSEHKAAVYGTDVLDYGTHYQNKTLNFIAPETNWTDFFVHVKGEDDDYMVLTPDWMITNPPFNIAEQFIQKCIDLKMPNVALFVRSSFAEGKRRYRRLFSVKPPKIEAVFCERVSLVPKKLDRKASLATSYCWMIWDLNEHKSKTQKVWIPPCRKELERDSDYD